VADAWTGLACDVNGDGLLDTCKATVEGVMCVMSIEETGGNPYMQGLFATAHTLCSGTNMGQSTPAFRRGRGRVIDLVLVRASPALGPALTLLPCRLPGPLRCRELEREQERVSELERELERWEKLSS
jgi:hypothetical protein